MVAEHEKFDGIFPLSDSKFIYGFALYITHLLFVFNWIYINELERCNNNSNKIIDHI